MSKKSFGLIICAVVAAVAAAQNPVTQPSQQPVMPYTPSLDVNAMDKSADPCVDFYQYSCGGWKKNNPIPPDQTSWEVYGKLYQDNLTYLRSLLEEASNGSHRDAVTQKIGDFYGACIDEVANLLGASVTMRAIRGLLQKR